MKLGLLTNYNEASTQILSVPNIRTYPWSNVAASSRKVAIALRRIHIPVFSKIWQSAA